MKEIRGDAKNVRSLLSASKYAIDYYQREYRWETKHIAELIEDLTGKFIESYDPTHERTEVERYGHYFLGSIIISDRDGRKFIIDGQQRLTSLTLLLIYLHRKLKDAEQQGQVAELIFSQKFGKRSFNLDVPERTACMEALYAGHPTDENGQPESIVNILGRFHDIEEQFPDDLLGPALPFFADWLLENVHLVEITAYSDEDAYTMFVVMKEIRGLPAGEVAAALTKRLASEPETFSSNDRFTLHGMNRRQIHRLLARMTGYLETSSGVASRFTEYVSGKGQKAYEVEHIWANHAERHADEFKHPSEFQDYRNRIGGLLLLPKSFNASYGDLPYADKRKHYLKQNLLAQTLHEDAYKNNPGLARFLKDSGLGFKPHQDFKKADLDARSRLYRQLAERIWDPVNLVREATS